VIDQRVVIYVIADERRDFQSLLLGRLLGAWSLMPRRKTAGAARSRVRPPRRVAGRSQGSMDPLDPTVHALLSSVDHGVGDRAHDVIPIIADHARATLRPLWRNSLNVVALAVCQKNTYIFVHE